MTLKNVDSTNVGRLNERSRPKD